MSSKDGIPEDEAEQYETELKKGKILISVEADDQNQIEKARDILSRNNANAKNINVSSQKASFRSY